MVYVDNDPIVLAHARALLTSTKEGRSAYIEADLCEPEKILADPALGDTLDLTKPVALMLVGILHFVPDEANPAHAVSVLLDALPPGSYLAASHGTPEFNPDGSAAWTRTYRDGGVPFQLRTADEFADLAFRGLEPSTLAWSWSRTGGRTARTRARFPERSASSAESPRS